MVLWRAAAAGQPLVDPAPRPRPCRLGGHRAGAVREEAPHPAGARGGQAHPAIPTELRNEEHELRRQIDLEDQERQGELFLSLHSTPFLIEQVECVVPVRLFAGRFAIFCVWLANDVFLRCDFVNRCRSSKELR